LYDILSAGFDAGDALKFLRVSAKAGVAGMSDTRKATEALIAVMHSYKYEIEDIEMVADKMFMTIRQGVLTFDELAGHIGLVASTAALGGVSFDELSASIAVLTRHGVRADHAIIAINNVINTFMNATDSAKATAKEFSDELEGMELSVAWLQKHGLAKALALFAKIPSGPLAEIHGTLRAKRGIFPLVEDLEAFNDVFMALKDSGGAMDEAFGKVAATFGHLLKQLKQISAVTLIVLGERLGPQLRQLAHTAIRLVQIITNLSEKHGKLMVAMVKAIPIIITFSAAMWGLGKAIAVVGVLSKGLGGGITGWVQLLGSLSAMFLALGLLKGLEDSTKGMSLQARIADFTAVDVEEMTELEKKVKETRDRVADLEAGYSKAQRAARKLITDNEEFINKYTPNWYPDLQKAINDELARSDYFLRHATEERKKLIGLDQKLTEEKKKQADAEEKMVELAKKRADLIAGAMRVGMYAGAWGRPKVLYAGAGFSPELNRLSEISDNTKKTNELLDGGLKIKSE